MGLYGEEKGKKNDIVMVFIVRVCRSGFHGISDENFLVICLR